jgi:hypothetical protein
MRSSSMLALAALAAALGAFVPETAVAFGSDPFVAPEGLDRPLGARKRVSRGDCAQQSTMCDDEYAYKYVRRPWYPGYNTGYWVPADEMRNRYRYSYTGPKYRYHPAWGVDRHGHAAPLINHDGKPLK